MGSRDALPGTGRRACMIFRCGFGFNVLFIPD